LYVFFPTENNLIIKGGPIKTWTKVLFSKCSFSSLIEAYGSSEKAGWYYWPVCGPFIQCRRHFLPQQPQGSGGMSGMSGRFRRVTTGPFLGDGPTQGSQIYLRPHLDFLLQNASVRRQSAGVQNSAVFSLKKFWVVWGFGLRLILLEDIVAIEICPMDPEDHILPQKVLKMSALTHFPAPTKTIGYF
jgi:hypothetical protein